MSMTLPPPNNFSIAKNPQAFFAPQQRQGAIVDNSVRRLVQDAKRLHPSLRTEFDIVLGKMVALRQNPRIQNSRIEVIQGPESKILIFRIYPATKRNWIFRIYPATTRNNVNNVNNDENYYLGTYQSNLNGSQILSILKNMLTGLRLIKD
jgi:hypothetical protein